MIKEIHRAETRGHADFGWLKSFHTFSFSSYFNPERVHFGALRVLNDDQVQAGMGFSTHGHDNMEIISIPLSGRIAHKDSIGTNGEIRPGEVQIMSAGTGIRHSEFNPSSEETLNFLQIWVLPKLQNIRPRYDQKFFESRDRKNKFQLIVSPQKDSEGLWINQDAYFSMIDLDQSTSVTYKNYLTKNGVYFFLIDGRVQIDDEWLGRRDGLGLEGKSEFLIQSEMNSRLLIMEVPI